MCRLGDRSGSRRSARVRRLRPLALALLALSCLAGLPSIAPGQSVEEFLEEYGLHELLAIRLEQRLERTTDEDERDAILLRLADLYAALLDRVADPQDRESLKERSRELLSMAPHGSATGLRLALLRSSYRLAEQTAERHRLRLVSDEELEEARDDLRAAIPELRELRALLLNRLEILDRRLELARRSELASITADIDRTEQLAAQTTFLLAWARYYQAWLEDRPGRAADAERLFAELLRVDTDVPLPEDVSIDLRADESFARSILGMALAKSLTSTSATALSWLALLEHPQANEVIREQLPAWRMSILLEQGDVAGALEQYRAIRERRSELPVPWMRLVAVLSLEQERFGVLVRELASLAVTDLAARGELDQVYDLAERYGVDRLGVSGFAVAYVKGALAYRDAQEMHDSEEPADDPKVQAAFAEAERALRSAVDQARGDANEAAIADARRLIAWCLYFQKQFVQAADRFVAIAGELSDPRAAEPLWMAIVSLDRHQQERQARGGEEDPAVAARIDELASQFLERFPEHEQAARLLIRRSMRIESPSLELVEELLLVPDSSPVHDLARRRAAQMLYRLFRNADTAGREALGAKYITVAAALNARDARTLAAGGDIEPERVALRARRLLEVSLHDRVMRIRAAVDALDRLNALIEGQDETNADVLAPDRGYWRVRLRLALGETAAAFDAALSAVDQPAPGEWDIRGAMAVLAYADQVWRSLEDRERIADETLRHIIALGPKVLPETLRSGVTAAEKPGEPSPPDPAELRVMALVAEAAYELFARSGHRAMGRDALRWHQAVLAWEPNDRGMLRRTGLLAERFNRDELALTCWRRLLAGLPRGSFDWFEARYHQIAILARRDADRAEDVLEQHASLYPEYGVEPWGSRLRALHERLVGRADSPIPREGEDEQGGQP